MTKIADMGFRGGAKPLFICDFSPPKGPSFDDPTLGLASSLSADCLSVPYNPGKGVYANSALAAQSLKERTGKEVAFTIATRDMNTLALHSLLLGAAMAGLQNIIVVQGDDFTPSERRHNRPVHDQTPTALIRSIAAMNEGVDYTGRALSSPTDFCVGATVDTNRNLEAEVALTRRKVEAGAHFLITQPGFIPDQSLAFLRAYERAYGAQLRIPIFFGIQMIAPNGRSFSPVPGSVCEDLSQGIDASAIAIRTVESFLHSGITQFYLVPPIHPGGSRDYRSAQRVLQHFGRQ